MAKKKKDRGVKVKGYKASKGCDSKYQWKGEGIGVHEG
jgi:hypothetical protein